MLAVFTKLRTTLVMALVFSGVVAQNALSRPKVLEGPIPAFVERVIDGDTLVVRARIWLGQELRVMVRINGIDAPEMRSHCEQERRLAISARRFVKRLVGQRKIALSNIHQGKYAGRVIAEVTDNSGSLLSDRLLKANLARPYKRGRRKGWCSKSAPQRYRKAQFRAISKTVAP